MAESQRFRPMAGNATEGLPPRLYEEYAYVLDYLQYGRPATDKPRHLALPTVQVIGESYFTLLEAEVRAGAQAALHASMMSARICSPYCSLLPVLK